MEDHIKIYDLLIYESYDLAGSFKDLTVLVYAFGKLIATRLMLQF